MKLSVIIPTCREANDSFVQQMAQSYPKASDIEYIVVDSGTEKEVSQSWRQAGFQVEAFEDSNRAQRLQRGFSLSRGDLIVFHHPRSLLEPEALSWLLEHINDLGWGGFTHHFDKNHWLLKFTSFYSNQVRPIVGKILYLDHCIFFRREFLDRPIPEIPIFEDTEISRILSRHGSPIVLPFTSTTSAVRFEKNGIFRQALLNQRVKLAYHLGRSRSKMNKEYEQGLGLNE